MEEAKEHITLVFKSLDSHGKLSGSTEIKGWGKMLVYNNPTLLLLLLIPNLVPAYHKVRAIVESILLNAVHVRS